MSERFSENQSDLSSMNPAEELDFSMAEAAAEAEASLLEEDGEQTEAPADKRDSAQWYVVHTYSGYENKVKDTLEKSIKSSGMEDFIFEVRVPVEEVTEIKKGKLVKTTRKIFPGYVIVNMIHTTQSWYVVRNTRGVTGFVGPDGKPIALTEAEIEMMLNPKPTATEFDLAIGEAVLIKEGQFTGQRGELVDIDKMLGKVLVKLQPFANRTTEQWFPMTDVISAEEE